MRQTQAARTVLLWAMWLLAGAYVVMLVLHAAGIGPSWDGWFGNLVDNWLGLLTLLAPVAVCWLAAVRARRRRPDVLLAAAAVTSYAVGDTFYLVTSFGGGAVPFPSVADIGYMLVYPLLLSALALTVRRHARGLAPWVWLDCAVGSLGAAAVLAVVMQPVLGSGDGLSPLATVAAIGPPVFDLVLVAFIAGVASLRDVGMGIRWILLASGLLVFAATDVSYGLLVTSDTYVLGTPLDAGWAIGLALMATWVDVASRTRPSAISSPRRATRAAAMAVSSVATVAGVAVLVVSSQMTVSPLALGLAAGALLAAAARTQLTNRLLERMAHQRLVAAATDELTGLPNRRAFYAEGHSRLVDPKNRQALLMLDLDRFKDVNDSYGHRAGDQLLAQVGARLRDSLRGDDALARLGGDEFAILLGDSGRDEALHAAARLARALAEPVSVEGAELGIGVSIGIALFPDDGTDLSQLLHKSDLAMYKAKTTRQGCHVYGPADGVDATTSLKTVPELRTAIETDQLVLHYQPKADLETGEVHGVEALVRWEHPTRGLLYPGAFLSLVEEAGLMSQLTQVVLAKALDQVAEWREGGQTLTVAVNISASSLCDDDLPDQVALMLAVRGLPAESLQLEITEEFVMGDRDLAGVILTRLHNSGITISVDDFGTGYSSLSYLRDLPIDEIKLDNSFVIPMTGDARASALVSSTITLAHSLGLRIVAEGVETAAAYTELSRMGCDEAQGHFMSRPLPADEFHRWLIHWQGLAESAELPRLDAVKV
ncbi:MAG TPA: EAL domain-containing protein [Propionicimonas sp.]